MKRQYYLENLDCANCAAKIETKLKKQAGVKEAVIDFVNRKLIVETHEEMTDETLTSLITPVITSIEHNVFPIAYDRAKQQTAESTVPHEHLHQNSHECSHEHSHEHGHTHSHEGKAPNTLKLLRLGTGTLIGFLSIFFLPEGPALLLGVLAGYLLISIRVLSTAARNILHSEIFDENFLMTLATIGAFLVGEYPEALAVMILYEIGEYLQDMAVDKSRKHLSDAMNIKAEYANLKTDKGIQTVKPEEVSINDIILVKPSERIPLDGLVVEGSSFIDTSSLTGESVPRKVSENEEILSGCINGSGTLYIKVTKPYEDSTVAKILDLVENASARKSPTENFITKFARIYTPIVVIAALLLAALPPIISGSFDFYPWIYKACGFLVVSCPCALVISVPLGFFGGIGCASKNGIIVKGSNYLEALNSVAYAVFDKTGVLTKGSFQVTQIVPYHGFTEEQILETAAVMESFSTHPIAKSITKSYSGKLETNELKDYEEIAGLGLRASFRGHSVLLGNLLLLEQNNIAYPSLHLTNGTVAHLSIDQQYAGYIIISDELKKDSKEAVKKLKARGIRTIMLTGDTEAAASYVAKELDLDAYYSQLLPGDKVHKIETIIENAGSKEKVLFVGDGINDAPVLARADVGAAMGGVGSDAAIEAADIVLMTDEPSQLSRAITIARFTRKIVSENIILSLGVKVLVMLLLVMGLGNMWIAIFADVGVAMIAIVNSIRTLKA